MQSNFKTTLLLTAAALITVFGGITAAQAGGYGRGAIDPSMLIGADPMAALLAGDEDSSPLADAVEAAGEVLDLDDGDDD